MSLISELFASLLDMPGTLIDVATSDPVAAVMMLFGGIFLLLSLGYFAILVLGAVASLVSPSGGGRVYPRAR